MLTKKWNLIYTGVLIAALTEAWPGYGQRPGGPAPAGPPAAADALMATQEQASDAIQRAYDALNRSAALPQPPSQGEGDILGKGRDAYQQALSKYQASNFVGAREDAMAAADLARAAEQIASANLIADGSKRLQLPAPPAASQPGLVNARAYQDLARASEHSVRVSSELSTGVANAQAHALVAQSQQLQQRAQTLLAASKPEEAAAIARASDALLAAADHLERRDLIASGRIPSASGPEGPGVGPAAPPPADQGTAPPPPPPGGPGGPPPPPQ